jgi:hypothetical protein
MFANRIIYIILLIASGVFASFYGGNITYVLFFAMLSLPLFCLIYTVYVNARFKIHQSIPKVRLVKMEKVPYHFTLANEDIFTFTSINVSFYSNTSHVSLDSEPSMHCLAPKSSEKIDGSVYGDYRGTYEIGAKSVEITDFLNLFQINYAIRSPLRLIVSPRILTLPGLNLATFIKDTDQTKHALIPTNEVIDTELRKYQSGDNRKLIHWKASAKKQELLTKKTVDSEEFETLLFVDLYKASPDEEINLIAEDKVIELALAIANHFLISLVPLRIIYEAVNRTEILLEHKEHLNHFYEQCSISKFQNSVPIHTIIQDYYAKHFNKDYYIIISAALNPTILEELYNLQKQGKQITYFFIRTKTDPDTDNYLKVLQYLGIQAYDIWMDEDLEKTFVS